MTYGRSLDHYLKHFGQARADGSTPAFTEMAFLAKDRAGLRKLLTASAFASRTCDRPGAASWCRQSEDMRRFMTKRAASTS
jgi:hypothetical protein